MAKGNRTTSTPRRATAAKATLQAAESLCRLEDEASVEVFGLEHLGELMAVWGDNMPPAGLSDREMLEIGNRIEYLGELVKRHAERIGRVLIDVRTTAERMTKGVQRERRTQQIFAARDMSEIRSWLIHMAREESVLLRLSFDPTAMDDGDAQ